MLDSVFSNTCSSYYITLIEYYNLMYINGLYYFNKINFKHHPVEYILQFFYCFSAAPADARANK
jgi:hypothetical protein